MGYNMFSTYMHLVKIISQMNISITSTDFLMRMFEKNLFVPSKYMVYKLQSPHNAIVKLPNSSCNFVPLDQLSFP